MKNKPLLIFFISFLLLCSLYTPVVFYFKIPFIWAAPPLTIAPFAGPQYFSERSVSISQNDRPIFFDETDFLKNYFQLFLARIYFNFFDRFYMFSPQIFKSVSLQFCKELRKKSNIPDGALSITLKSRYGKNEKQRQFFCE